MKIRFETTIEDVIAFNRFHLANSPTWWREKVKAAFSIPAVLGVLLLVAFLTRDLWDHAHAVRLDFVAIGAVLLVVLLVSAFLMPWLMWRQHEHTLRKFLAEGSNRSMLGWRELELVDNRLVSTNELIHSSIDLRAIEKIVSNDRYTFVYIAAAQAFSIPMKLYPEDEYRAFVAELREAWDNRGLNLPRENAEPAPSPADERVMKRRDY